MEFKRIWKLGYSKVFNWDQRIKLDCNTIVICFILELEKLVSSDLKKKILLHTQHCCGYLQMRFENISRVRNGAQRENFAIFIYSGLENEISSIAVDVYT